MSNIVKIMSDGLKLRLKRQTSKFMVSDDTKQYGLKSDKISVSQNEKT